MRLRGAQPPPSTNACSASLQIVLVARESVRHDTVTREAAVSQIVIHNARTHTLRLANSSVEVNVVTTLLNASPAEIAVRTERYLAKHAKLRHVARYFLAWFRAPGTAPPVPVQKLPGLIEALHTP